MIQRIQTLWLLLASACGFCTLNFPFYGGIKAVDKTYHDLTAKESNIILVLSIAVAVASIINIFIFKNRKLQLRILLTSLFISIIVIVLYFLQVKNYSNGNYSLWALFSLAIPVFLVMAARGIYKDEKLIKSQERLR